MDRVHAPRRPRNLSIDEERELNDNWHPIGCGCPDCLPEAHSAAPCEPSLGSPEAA